MDIITTNQLPVEYSTSIKSLIPDIYKLVQRKDGWFNARLADDLSTSISLRLREHYNRDPNKPRLRLSQMGARCPKALWYSIHHPEMAEVLPPWATLKYSYGHILEAQTIALAKAAGHEVTGEQDEVEVDGILGHRDCVIDGCIVDVKSSSSRGFDKFKNGTIAQDDDFGYLDQLDGYLVGSLNDPLVRVKDRAYLLAIDKQLGHMVIYEHKIREASIRARIQEAKAIVELHGPPPCQCETIPDGASGNIRLGVKASYSPFKHQCFPNLRTFLYANGPRYLTQVVRKPDVMEIDKDGKAIFR